MNLDELVEIGKSAKVFVGHLDFDVNNPRFTPDKRPESDSDAAIIEKLATLPTDTWKNVHSWVSDLVEECIKALGPDTIVF